MSASWSDALLEAGHVVLEARDPTRNIARSYVVIMSRDLFGAHMVDCFWGRIGSRGQSKRVSFPDRAEAQRHARHVLKKRSGAHKRIGVPYSLVSAGTGSTRQA